MLYQALQAPALLRPRSLLPEQLRHGRFQQSRGLPAAGKGHKKVSETRRQCLYPLETVGKRRVEQLFGSSGWSCPVCNCRLWPMELVVDGFVEEVLAKTEDVHRFSTDFHRSFNDFQ